MVYDVNKIGYEGGEYEAVMKGGDCLAITRNVDGEKYVTIPVECSRNFPNARVFISGTGDKNYNILTGRTELCLPAPKEFKVAGDDFTIKRISFYTNGNFAPTKIDFSNVNTDGLLSLVFRTDLSRKDTEVIFPSTPPKGLEINATSRGMIDLTPYVCYGINVDSSTPIKIGRLGGRDTVTLTAVDGLIEIGSIDADVKDFSLMYSSEETILKVADAIGEQNRGMFFYIKMRDGEYIGDEVKNRLFRLKQDYEIDVQSGDYLPNLP